eukprot:TRINITY_DN18943_c0_g1_i2.p1 TRINITY_DN18943_c0_g1~~TRINITY_DN18943_c0_g1_i2.p1  ORF type:complete len:387 (-),score=34.34 TRINITY_DN18943_c0_g1_i2:106-1185(-)
MVVCQVTRVRNSTLRTFRIEAGDPFYTPRVDGQPQGSEPIEVPPGFDQATEGLTVPWELLTRNGLVITEVGGDPDAMLRCVIGPCDEDSDKDWLRFHSASWDPLAPEKWTLVGDRHLLGTIGGQSDWQLMFRDGRASREHVPASLEEVVHFDRAVVSAPINTVFLNVFDLASALSIPNAILNNTVINTVGAFHAAVEVYGEEWSFYRTPSPNSCGVCKSVRPRSHPVHVYRQSVDMGQTGLQEWEVRYLIRAKLAQQWPGGAYELLSRNCIHFCDELLLSLGVQKVPPWVRKLHETGCAVLRIPWPLSLMVGGSTDSGRREGKSATTAPPEMYPNLASHLQEWNSSSLTRHPNSPALLM